MTTVASESSSRPTVWLFRTPNGSSSHTDPYRVELAGQGYRAVHIPVLKDEFRTQQLEEVFRSKEQRWDGVIITSKRGAEGWVRAARAVCEGGSESSMGELPFCPNLLLGSDAYPDRLLFNTVIYSWPVVYRYLDFLYTPSRLATGPLQFYQRKISDSSRSLDHLP